MKLFIKKKQEKQKSNEKIFEKYKNINSLNKIIIDEFISKILISNINPEIKERDIVVEWEILKIED
jgi:hypothetical protein